jgi:structural maintenance of chromosome 2
LDSELDALRISDQEIQSLNERRSYILESLEKSTMERKLAISQLARLKDELHRLEKSVKSILKEHPWIPDNEHLFNQPGTPFDTASVNLSNLQQTVRSLEQKQAAQRKTINVNVIEMIDRVEGKEASLQTMLNTVKKDKSKIEDTIDKLEEYKIDALERTWHQVNEYHIYFYFFSKTLGILAQSLESCCQAVLQD